ncbi:hypothetical protein [Dethiothermospora halolimnae]|uniref:hypothetical protein n=1 Tax=Dethiothermospora halolimnae TaxID=3114390 RepID=UPI003CCC3D6B
MKGKLLSILLVLGLILGLSTSVMAMEDTEWNSAKGGTWYPVGVGEDYLGYSKVEKIVFLSSEKSKEIFSILESKEAIDLLKIDKTDVLTKEQTKKVAILIGVKENDLDWMVGLPTEALVLTSPYESSKHQYEELKNSKTGKLILKYQCIKNCIKPPFYDILVEFTKWDSNKIENPRGQVGKFVEGVYDIKKID